MFIQEWAEPYKGSMCDVSHESLGGLEEEIMHSCTSGIESKDCKF